MRGREGERDGKDEQRRGEESRCHSFVCVLVCVCVCLRGGVGRVKRRGVVRRKEGLIGEREGDEGDDRMREERSERENDRPIL